LRILGLIPARGGSKGIPRKNLSLLGGRPLIAWTADAALASRALSRVVVSTDDAEIAAVARSCGLEVPFMRPPALATDQSGALGVIRHAVEMLEARGDRWDAVVYLQPTSPLRRSEHIDQAVAIFRAKAADSVVTVIEVPHNMSLGSQLTMQSDGRVFALTSQDDQTFRRQDKPLGYARNGPAVLVVSRACVIDKNTLYGERIYGMVMDQIDSMDVDRPEDLELIEAWIRWRRRKDGS